MKFFFALQFAVLVCKVSFAQQLSQVDSIKILKPGQQAYYYARHLSSGALLVRLKTRTAAIEALKKMGHPEAADKIIQQQFDENKTITRNFRKYFTYCPVYFFYNTHTDSVLAGLTTGIFLDTNLVADKNIKLKESFYLTAEDGNLELSNQVEKGDSTDNNPVATYTARTGGILVMDRRFNLLKRPFPYFTHYGGFNNFGKAVIKLNAALMDIYPYKSKN